MIEAFTLNRTRRSNVSRRGNRLLFWSPRILAILFALFLSLFAVDAFNGSRGFWGAMVALAIRLLPAGTVVVVLLASWRREQMGATLFTLMAVLFAVRVMPAHPSWAAMISIPLLVVAGLFLAGWLSARPARAAH